MNQLKQTSVTKIFLSFLLFLLALATCPNAYSLTGTNVDYVQFSLLSGDHQKAYNLSKEFLGSSADVNNKADLSYYIGIASLYLGKYAESETSFKEILNQEISPVLKQKVYLGLMDALFLDERYEEAAKIADAMIKEFPQTDFKSTYLFKLARINFKLAQWDQAQQSLDKTLVEYPRSPEIFAAKIFKQERNFFSVQVASFQDKAKALKLMHELKGKAEKIYLSELKDITGRTYYRVRVGQFSQLALAKEYVKQLNKLGFSTKIYP